MTTKVVGLLLAALLGLAGPAAAEHDNGFDNDDDGQIDELDEHINPGPPISGGEVACQAYGRIENCLPYHQTYCQQFGLPLACRMAALGSNCYGGEPGQCQYYLAIIQTNVACGAGDQNACTWLYQQPILQ